MTHRKPEQIRNAEIPSQSERDRGVIQQWLRHGFVDRDDIDLVLGDQGLVVTVGPGAPTPQIVLRAGRLRVVVVRVDDKPEPASA